MRRIDDQAIKAHADVRFRSEYDYALFEYFRSAKVIRFLEASGVPIQGRILDAGCGGGGMPLSLAEESRAVVGIDLVARFKGAGTRLAIERGITNLVFLQADGMALPFQDASFDLVLSHAVIEHVADAPRYLRECARVLRPGGWMYLSTAPYLSLPGAHLPRLRVLPLPLHLIVGRQAAFSAFTMLARRAPWSLREPEDQNTFIKLARQGTVKRDDLLERIRIRRLRRQITEAGLTISREAMQVTGAFHRLPSFLAAWLRESPLTQDLVVGNLQYVLHREGAR